MPELPEVETTVNGLQKHLRGLTIVDVWSNYKSSYFLGKNTVKDPTFLKYFKENTIGSKIIEVKRRGKNILIGLNNEKTILVHMKMTGHLLYGQYQYEIGKKKDPWIPLSPPGLKDPFNRRVRFVITFDNGKKLALSDTRKFAKVTLVDSSHIKHSVHLKNLGPEPLDKDFTFETFVSRLNKKRNWKIKQVIMDQTIIAGIGNIYADESLWRAGINPLQKVRDVSHPQAKILFKSIKLLLQKGINLGGDSMSDYRNIFGEKGKFQEEHRAYRKTGLKCSKKNCTGTIQRIVVGGRATHYCDKHQGM